MAVTVFRCRQAGPKLLGFNYGKKIAFNPTSVVSPNFTDTTLSVPGAELGDWVLATTVTGAVPAGGLMWAFVNAVDTVTIRFYGINAAATVDFVGNNDFNVLLIKKER